MVAFTSPMSTNSKKSLRFRSKKKITLKINFEINSDFWSLLFMIIPPNFLCTPLYFYSLFLCFSLLYFCTFFLLLFSFYEKKNFHWFLFLLPIFPLILFIFIFATTAENLLIKTSAIWKEKLQFCLLRWMFFSKVSKKPQTG